MAKGRFHGGVMLTGHGDRARQNVKTQRLNAAIEANQKAKDAKGPRNSSVLSKIDGLMHGRPPRFALVRTLGGLGDALMVTPTFKALKEKYPDCHITYGTTKEYSGGVLFDVLQNNPYIDELVPYQQIKKESFDIFADLTAIGVKDEYILNAPKDRQTMWGNYVGIDIDDGQCVYAVDEDERKWAKDWLDDHKKVRKSRFIVIQPGSFADRRNWPRDTMIEFIKEMHSHDNSLVFLIHDYNVGEYKDIWSSLANCINISEYNIRSIAALMEQSDLVIAHDSGLLHLAGALDCKIVSIFGSTHPQSRINWFKNCIAVWQKDLACAPCWYKACKNHYYCMKSLAIEDVFNATLFMLDEWNIGTSNDLSKLKNVDYFYGITYNTGKYEDPGKDFLEWKNPHAISALSPTPIRVTDDFTVKTSILMVTMNNLDYLKNTISDVIKFSSDFELLIHQNARVKNSQISKYLDSLAKRHSNVKVFNSEVNLGFLEPNNMLAKRMSGKYMCLLNDDMTLCKGWLDTLTDALELDPTLAQVGSGIPRILASDGIGHATSDYKNIDYIEASCTVLPRHIYEQYGLFDGDTYSFAYNEDSDLSLSLREQGWNISFIDIPIVHHTNKTSATIIDEVKGYAEQNASAFRDKWKCYLKSKSFQYSIGVKVDKEISYKNIKNSIKALKLTYPLSRITIIADSIEPFKNDEHVYSVTSNSDTKRYDMCIDAKIMNGNSRRESKDNGNIEIERCVPVPLQETFIDSSVNEQIDTKSISSILIVKLDHIGDFILSVPAMQLLNERFPDAKISIITASWNKQLAERLGFIDNIFEFDFFNKQSDQGLSAKDTALLKSELSKHAFDLAIDLRRHPETRSVMKLANAKYNVGYDDHWLSISASCNKEESGRSDYIPHITTQLCQLVNMIKPGKIHVPEPKFKFSAKEKAAIKSKIKLLALKKKLVIGISPGVGAKIRQWPLDNYAKLIDNIISKTGANIVLFGSPEEKEEAQKVYDSSSHKKNITILAGDLSIPEFMLATKECDLFIGNNSGSGHMAAISNIPTLIVFSGQVLPGQWHPLGEKSFVVYKQEACVPCYKALPDQCGFGVKCMRSIDPDTVSNIANKMIELSKKNKLHITALRRELRERD